MALTISFLLKTVRRNDFLMEHWLRGLSSDVSCPRTAAISVIGSKMLTSQEIGECLVKMLILCVSLWQNQTGWQGWLLRLPGTVNRRGEDPGGWPGCGRPAPSPTPHRPFCRDLQTQLCVPPTLLVPSVVLSLLVLWWATAAGRVLLFQSVLGLGWETFCEVYEPWTRNPSKHLCEDPALVWNSKEKAHKYSWK